ncbi:MAG TPA: hypothetical protein VJ914_11810 [Pseudonocardiaceae bacterium]|nr:hypothetical protein [Pseudonocardiaceae bacterium]
MRAKSLLAGAVLLAGLGVVAGCSSTVAGSPTAAGPGGSQGGGAGSQLGSQVKTVSDLSNLVGNSVEQADTVQVTMKSGVGTTTGSIKFGDPVAEHMTVSTAAGSEQVLLVDNVFYMQIPGMQQLTNKPWIKFDPSNTSDPTSQLFGALINSIKENADPSQMIKNLEAGGTLTGTDTEQLNGQSTTHYKITVDIDKMIANQTDPTMKQMLGLAEQQGLHNYPVEVWLDSHGLPLQTTINMPSLSGAPGSGGVSTVTYTNWGAPVTISAPPDDQVGTMPTMPGTGG